MKRLLVALLLLLATPALAADPLVVFVMRADSTALNIMVPGVEVSEGGPGSKNYTGLKLIYNDSAAVFDTVAVAIGGADTTATMLIFITADMPIDFVRGEFRVSPGGEIVPK